MAELPTINIDLYAQTDVGMVRSGNEDNFLILDLSTGKSWTANEEEPQDLLSYSQGYYGTLLAVSDGMGGALAGEVASRMAVDTVRHRMLYLQAQDHYKELPFQERMRLAIEEANILINSESQTNPAHKGLGATFTAAAIFGTELFFAQVGDSRAHILRNGNLYRVTKDQSLVQQLIDAGQITEEEAETHHYRNVILQALGAHSNVNVEVNRVSLCKDDILIICSDGLTGKLNQSGIAQIISESDDFRTACQQLIDSANDLGGEDNITVVIAKFTGDELPLLPDADDKELESTHLQRLSNTPTEINWNIGGETNPLELPNNVSQNGDLDDPSLSAKPSFAVTAELPRLPFLASEQTQQAVTASVNDVSQEVSSENIQTVGSADGAGSAARRGPITIVLPQSNNNDSDSTKDALIEAEQSNSDTQHQSINDFFTDDFEQHNQLNNNAVKLAPFKEVGSESPTGELDVPSQAHSQSMTTTRPAPPPSTAAISQYAPIVIPRTETAPLKKSRATFYIIIGLVAIGIGGITAGGYSYYIRQSRDASVIENAESKAQAEYQTQKDTQISKLRDKVSELNKRIQAMQQQPELQEKYTLSSIELRDINQRLEIVNATVPANDYQKVNQNCDEITRDLLKLEADLGN